ncbi:MAG: DUF4367 domain-containing protein [Clostridiales bacterium]|nr:DUF4367 domain-containing protein [Clostridiales bacterium]
MTDDNMKKNREDIYNDYEDSLFRLVMNKVAEKEGESLAREAKNLKESPEYILTGEVEKSFADLLDAQIKKKKQNGKKPGTRKVFKRTITVIAALFVLFSISIMSVSAFRIKIFNLIIDVNEKYTSFQLQGTEEPSTESQLPADWKSAYGPTYVPEGYRASYVNNTVPIKIILFSNTKDSSLEIVYSEYGVDSNLSIDTENADYSKDITINDNDGMIVEKAGMVTAIWKMEDRMFTVQGRISREEILKIAESVRYIN